MEVLLKEQRQRFMTAAREDTCNAYLGRIVLGDQLVIDGAGPCHGNYARHRANVDYLLWCPRFHNNVWSEKGLIREWVEWFVNESMFADVFISKSYDEIAEFGYLARTDLPTNLVHFACQMSRFPTEKYCNFQPLRNTYKSFRKIMSVEDSYYFSFLFSHRKESKKEFAIVSPFVNGHTPFDNNLITEEHVRRWLGRDPILDEKTWKERGQYRDMPIKLHTTFGSQAKEGNPPFLRQIKAMIPREESVVKNLNIFAKVIDSRAFEITPEGIGDIINQIKESCRA